MARLTTTLLFVLAASQAASAADDEVVTIEIATGETLEIEVGYARMFRCDDMSFLDAEVRNKNPSTNVFIVHGRAPGSTLCRVGLEENRPSILFAVTVTNDRVARTPGTK